MNVGSSDSPVKRIIATKARRSAYLMAYVEPAYPDEAKARAIGTGFTDFNE